MCVCVDGGWAVCILPECVHMQRVCMWKGVGEYVRVCVCVCACVVLCSQTLSRTVQVCVYKSFLKNTAYLKGLEMPHCQSAAFSLLFGSYFSACLPFILK